MAIESKVPSWLRDVFEKSASKDVRDILKTMGSQEFNNQKQSEFIIYVNVAMHCTNVKQIAFQMETKVEIVKTIEKELCQLINKGREEKDVIEVNEFLKYLKEFIET